MIVKTSDKFNIVLDLVQGSHTSPATALRTAEASLRTLIPEIEALEARLEELEARGPQDAAPTPLDELRKRQEELQASIQEGVTRFKGDLARKLREAAQALNPEE